MADEDLTTYIEVDTGNFLTVIANKVTANDSDWTPDNYVYKDFGVGFFDGDFGFLLEHETTDVGLAQGGFARICDLGNTVGNWNDLVADGELISINHNISAPNAALGKEQIALVIVDGISGAQSDATAVLAWNKYYSKLVRDETVGGNGTQYLYLYSDAGRTILVDTLILAWGEKVDFRYLYAWNQRSSSSGYSYDGYIQNLDLTPHEIPANNYFSSASYLSRRRN